MVRVQSAMLGQGKCHFQAARFSSQDAWKGLVGDPLEWDAGIGVE